MFGQSVMLRPIINKGIGRVIESILDLNPALDMDAIGDRFRRDRRVQIRDLLTPAAADAIHNLLAHHTPWGLGWRAGEDGPHALDAAALAALPMEERNAVATRIFKAMQSTGEYAFSYARYPILDAYLTQAHPDSPYDILFEHLNDAPFMNFIRKIKGLQELHKADAQATLFAPNQFLPLHVDSHAAEGWRVAYVLGMCREEWRHDWGGYLNFFDEDGDVIAGYRPRFNTLSLFEVPTPHAVSYVPPFAPIGRFSITGWFRDR